MVSLINLVKGGFSLTDSSCHISEKTHTYTYLSQVCPGFGRVWTSWVLISDLPLGTYSIILSLSIMIEMSVWEWAGKKKKKSPHSFQLLHTWTALIRRESTWPHSLGFFLSARLSLRGIWRRFDSSLRPVMNTPWSLYGCVMDARQYQQESKLSQRVPRMCVFNVRDESNCSNWNDAERWAGTSFCATSWFRVWNLLRLHSDF